MTVAESPLTGYDQVIFDLDGVVYLDREPIPGAVEAVNGIADGGLPVAYATNNASRRAGEVAALLTDLGVHARADQVVTSAHVSALLLASRLPAGAHVLVVGGPALSAEVADVGLVPVGRADDKPAAVVQGYDAKVGWADLAEGCVAVRAGAWWVATNADRTLPSPRGPLPGNGSLVAALATALGREPDDIVGKPAPALFTTAAGRIGAVRPLVVGDRLDTDMGGATAAGFDGLLVLTGVATPADVLAAPEGTRPTWIAMDLTGWRDGGAAARVPVKNGDAAQCGGWTARRANAGLDLHGDGPPAAALAALAALAWFEGVVPPIRAANEAAATALRTLRLAG